MALCVRHLRELKAVSGAILESSWEAFLQLVGEDDYNLYVWGKYLNLIRISHFDENSKI